MSDKTVVKGSKPAAASQPMGGLASLLRKSAPGESGKPLMLRMDHVREDPAQPRTEDNPGFSKESIADIGQSIVTRGVKTPISVRDDSELGPGYYIINHGARRYRGSKWAEKEFIPAWLDNDYMPADQVIENIKRSELTPREIANWIGREIASGKKKIEIARELSVSQAFVTQHAVLLELPDPIAEAFNSGRVGDVTVVNELVKAYKADPVKTAEWLADDTQEMTRQAMKMLRAWIEGEAESGGQGQGDAGGQGQGDAGGQGQGDAGGQGQGDTGGQGQGDAGGQGQGDTGGQGQGDAGGQGQGDAGGQGQGDAGGQGQGDVGGEPKKSKQPDPDAFKKAIVQITHNGQDGRLLLNRRPVEGQVWVRYDDDGSEDQIPATEIRVVGLIEGAL